jgi:hypothetical protein
MLPSSAIPKMSQKQELRAVDTALWRYVKLRCAFRVKQGGIRPGLTACFPCHCGQNPYKARHPWVPAGN